MLINETRGYNLTVEPQILEALHLYVFILIYRCRIYSYYVHTFHLREKANVLEAAVFK